MRTAGGTLRLTRASSHHTDTGFALPPGLCQERTHRQIGCRYIDRGTILLMFLPWRLVFVVLHEVPGWGLDPLERGSCDSELELILADSDIDLVLAKLGPGR